MRKKTRSYCWLLLMATLIGGVGACHRDHVENQGRATLYDPNVALNIHTAQVYYAQLKSLQGDTAQNGTIKTLSTSSAAKTNKKYALFSKAYSGQTNDVSFVESPLLYNKRSSSIINSSKSPLNTSQEAQLLNISFDRLIIYKDKKSGEISQKIVTYLPSMDYLAKHHNDISNNQIDHIDSDFNGYILYKEWNGQTLSLLKIKNGKGIKRYYPGQPNNKSGTKVNLSVNPVQTNQVCTDYYWDVYEQDCYYPDPESSGYENCDDWVLVSHTFLYQICSDDGSDPGSNDPCLNPYNFNPACSQSGGENPTVTQPPTDPCGTNKTTAAQNVNNMVAGNSSFSSAFTQTQQYSTNGYESAFYVDYSSNSYSASTPVRAASNNDQLSTANLDANTVAIGHGHAASNFPQPSPYDMYSLGELAVSTNGRITMDFTLSATSKYNLVVTDRSQFNTFLTNFGETNLQKDANGNYTGDLDGSQPLGGEVFTVGYRAASTYNLYHSLDPTNPTAAELQAAQYAGNEAGFVYLLSNYNTGMVLLKADNSGTFHALHYIATTMPNGTIVYSTSPCN